MILVLMACESKEKTAIEQLQAQEEKVKERQDDLPLGLHLGMKKHDFYVYCAKKNQSLEFLDGGRYGQVLKEFKGEEFSSPVDFWFYPVFDGSEIIVGQENKFKFKGWAPWNKEMDATHLLPEVLDYLSTQFGEDFIELETTDEELQHFVDIDANRRIDVYTKKLDDAYVYMDVEDLRK